MIAALVSMVLAMAAYAGTITHESQNLTFGTSIHTDYTVRYNYLQADFEKDGLTRLYYLLSPMKSCKTKAESSITECKKVKLVDVQVLTQEDNCFVCMWKASAKKPSTVGLYIDTYANEAGVVKEAWHNFLFDPPLAGFAPQKSKVRWVFEIDGANRQIIWNLDENTLTVSDLQITECKKVEPAPVMKEPVKRVEIGKKMVYFPYSQSIIEASEEKTLQVFIDELNTNPQAMLQVECHADPYGTDEFNVDLSKKRAESVRDYLKAKGILPERLATRWFGKSQPVAECHSVEECRVNRRCEVLLFYEGTK